MENVQGRSAQLSRAVSGGHRPCSSSQPAVPLATPANASKGAALDFQGLWPLLALGRNASLTLRDVSVRGVPPVEAAAGSPYPWRAAEVLTPGFLLGGWALALYPSIILEDGSQAGRPLAGCAGPHLYRACYCSQVPPGFVFAAAPRLGG